MSLSLTTAIVERFNAQQGLEFIQTMENVIKTSAQQGQFNKPMAVANNSNVRQDLQKWVEYV
jgi:hypothetical protein